MDEKMLRLVVVAVVAVAIVVAVAVAADALGFWSGGGLRFRFGSWFGNGRSPADAGLRDAAAGRRGAGVSGLGVPRRVGPWLNPPSRPTRRGRPAAAAKGMPTTDDGSTSGRRRFPTGRRRAKAEYAGGSMGSRVLKGEAWKEGEAAERVTRWGSGRARFVSSKRAWSSEDRVCVRVQTARNSSQPLQRVAEELYLPSKKSSKLASKKLSAMAASWRRDALCGELLEPDTPHRIAGARTDRR